MEIESPTMLRESTNLGSKEETQRHKHISATCCRVLCEVYAPSLTYDYGSRSASSPTVSKQ